jgi:hypothetical protein
MCILEEEFEDTKGVIRKDMDVNKHETPSNITHGHRL